MIRPDSGSGDLPQYGGLGPEVTDQWSGSLALTGCPNRLNPTGWAAKEQPTKRYELRSGSNDEMN